MRTTCAVSGCPETSYTSSDSGELRFHQLPKDEERRQKWAELVGRPDLTNPNIKRNSHFVCSQHFHPSVVTYKVQLRPDALPTMYLPHDPATHQVFEPIELITKEISTQTETSHTQELNMDLKESEKEMSPNELYQIKQEVETESSLSFVEVEAEEWLSSPDVCRCCLASRGVWDLTGSYMAEDGETEVFQQMLADCYGIKLSHVSEFGPSRLVCAECVASLRRANRFKRQVLQAEEKFAAYIGKPEDTIIKEEFPEDTDDFETHENVVFTHQYPEVEVKIENESMEEECEDSIPQASTQQYEPSSSVRTTQERIKRMMDATDDECDDETPHRPLAIPQKRMKEITYSKKNVQVISYCPKKDEAVAQNIVEKNKGKGRGKKMKIQANTSAAGDTAVENLGQSEPVPVGFINTMVASENVKSEETLIYGSHSVKTPGEQNKGFVPKMSKEIGPLDTVTGTIGTNVAGPSASLKMIVQRKGPKS